MEGTANILYNFFNPSKAIVTPQPKSILPPKNGNYGIRQFQKNKYEDILRLIEIDIQKELQEFMLPKHPSSIRYYKNLLSQKNQGFKIPWYVFGITDSKNEIIGWIQFSLSSNMRWIRSKFKIEPKSLVMEIAYAKLFNNSNKQVIVNGLKKMLDLLSKCDDRLFPVPKNKSKCIYISAFSDPRNVASERVLEINEFIKLKRQIFYDKADETPSNVWIKKIN